LYKFQAGKFSEKKEDDIVEVNLLCLVLLISKVFRELHTEDAD